MREQENLDDMLKLDPELTKKINDYKRPFRTLSSAITKLGLGEDTGSLKRDFEVYLQNALIDSVERGERSSADEISFEESIGPGGELGAYSRIAKRIADDIIKKIFAEAQSKYGDDVERLLSAKENAKKDVEEAAEKVLKEELTESEIKEFLAAANTDRKLARSMAIESRNKHLETFEAAKQQIEDLGLSAFTTIYETSSLAPHGGDAYGYYAPSSSRRGVYDINNNLVKFAEDDSLVHIMLDMYENEVDPSQAIKSTVIHEYAHYALDRVENRAPIITDIINIIRPGLDAKVVEIIANSRDATELVAYVTQKKFLNEMNGGKNPEWNDDAVVQAHLDSILKNMGIKEGVDFTQAKKSFMNLIKSAFTFVKTKLIGRLRDVNTFNDFYRGLVNGEFNTEMRVSAVGTKYSKADTVPVFDDFVMFRDENGEIVYKPQRALVPNTSLDFRLSDAEFIGLKMAEDIQTLKDNIAKNEAEQERLLDEIKNDAAELLVEAQKMAKGSPIELDIESFVNVELTNAIKAAMKRNNDIGQIQNVLNEAVQKANPYVPRNTVIKARAGEAAQKFRKRLNKRMAFKKNTEKKTADKVNAAADKVFDYVTEKVTGRRNQISAINDAELTRILNSGGDGHTIRYLVDGKEQRFTLTGPGSEEFVKEFYAPEYVIKGAFAQRLLNATKWIANKKRETTTSWDPTRVLPNIARDWSRGIVTTGGEILLSPDMLRTEAIERYGNDEKTINKINDGFRLAQENQSGSTFTQSMSTAKKDRPKSMVRAMRSEDGNAYTRYKAKTTDEKLSMLQDMGEEMTRNRAMSVAYYKTLSECAARGMKIDDAIKEAVAASYFYGREATTNFSRRGKLISTIAQNVPYLSQKFASIESFKYAYLDNPIAVGRALKATVTAYSALIAIALSNDESRKKYYLLSEYDRANNIIIPLTNDTIMTIPLDENIAAFLTPYRRMIESLNGVDPEAFYLWGAEFLEALSPLDLTGFSEGDSFNVVRGFQKLGSELIPTWAMPFLESATGTDWYYGSNIRIDEEYVGARTGNYTPTAGELTTKSNNSRLLASISNGTGIPQWILQRFVQQYGGNVGQYVVNGIDKLTGATEAEQGGKDFKDAIFKPFTGMDSDQASQAFWDGVNQIEEKKKRVQNEIRTLNNKIAGAAGEEKAQLQKQRQEKISKYGTEITDFLDQYLSAYELTGGLTKQQANRVWRLYVLYDQDKNESLYPEGSVSEYFSDKASKQNNKLATNLAAQSGLDKYYNANGLNDHDTTYAMQALKNTIYGVPTQHMVNLANILEDKTDYNNSLTKLRSDAYDARKKAYDVKNYTLADKIAYEYDYRIFRAIYPYLIQNGIVDILNNSTVMDYLEDWIMVPSEEMRTSKGKYVPNLGKDAQKEKAFKKQFIKKMLGVAGE